MISPEDGDLFRVFAVELDESVGTQLRADRPNMYVGRTPQGALEQHLRRLLAGAIGPEELRGHVVRDRLDLYGHFNPKTEKRARETERELACQLIRRWHDVFGRTRYRVYVIKLDPSTKHPESARPWVYVGLTSKTPERRYQEHKSGARNRRGRLYNTHARDYGVGLWRKYYASISPSCSLEEAKKKEEHLAMRLHHDKGFRVEGDGLPPALRGT